MRNLTNCAKPQPFTFVRNSLALPFLAFVGMAFSTANLKAQALVSLVGSETGSGANGYSVQNWSNPDIAKLYDIGGSERFGSAGYYQFNPMAWNPGTLSNSVPLSANTDLMVSSGTYPNLISNPSFLGSIKTTGSAGLVNYDGYGIYRAPDGSSLVRQGALSVSVGVGPYQPPGLVKSSFLGEAINFTLSSAAEFRLGLAVDSVGSGVYAPDFISLYNGISSVFAPITADGNADMVFYDVRGNLGDTLWVGLWQAADRSPSNIGTATLSLVTFDVIPEPSTGVLSFLGLAVLAALRPRRRS